MFVEKSAAKLVSFWGWVTLFWHAKLHTCIVNLLCYLMLCTDKHTVRHLCCSSDIRKLEQIQEWALSVVCYWCKTNSCIQQNYHRFVCDGCKPCIKWKTVWWPLTLHTYLLLPIGNNYYPLKFWFHHIQILDCCLIWQT